MTAKKLPKVGRTLKVSVGDHIDYEDGDRRGDNTYAFNVKLKRVR